MARTPYALRARRLLALLHLFEPETRLSVSAIAETLGVTEEEITDDLDLLSCCGIDEHDAGTLVPIFVEDGVVEIWSTLPALDRAVRLSAAESRALAAALETAGLSSDDPLHTKLLGAAAWAEADASELERLVRAAGTQGSAADALKTISLALQERAPVRILYHGVGRDEATERVVEPMGLVNERGVWYLEAFCRRAGALRVFRVDRIREAAALPERFEPRALSPAGTAFVSAGLPVARVLLAPGEQVTDREWPGMRLAEERPDGSVLVEVPYAGTGWIARQVLARLGAAEVLGPAEVREAVVALADTVTA